MGIEFIVELNVGVWSATVYIVDVENADVVNGDQVIENNIRDATFCFIRSSFAVFLNYEDIVGPSGISGNAVFVCPIGSGITNSDRTISGSFQVIIDSFLISARVKGPKV